MLFSNDLSFIVHDGAETMNLEYTRTQGAYHPQPMQIKLELCLI